MQAQHLGKLILVIAALSLVIGVSAQNSNTYAPNPTSRIIAPPRGFTFHDEHFVYGAEWRIWNAGIVSLGVSREGVQTRVSASAEASGVVSMLYPVHDRFQSLFNPATFCSLALQKHSEEGLHKRNTLINYDYARHKSVLDETNLKTNESKHVETDIPGCVTDVLSGIMYLRALPLLPGSSFTFPLSDGGKTVDVTAKVEAKETITVPAGTFQTVRVSPEANSGTVKNKGRIWIWYTDDAAHIPVQMRGRLFWGTITFKLQHFDRK